jgi:hypothetical protein
MEGPQNPHQWREINSLLDEIATELEVGQIVGTEKLSMETAMSAIEIMDVKMDTGVGASDAHTLEEALQLKEISSSSSLSEKQILGAVDKLFIFEMMWLEGYALTQSTYTCLYMHRPDLMFDDAYFAPIGFSLLKRTKLIHNAILAGDVYSEEDYCRIHGIGDFFDKDENTLTSLMQKAESSLLSRKDQSEEEAAITNAVLARVRFSRAWTESVRFMSDRNLTQAKKSLNTVKSLLGTISKTTSLGEYPHHIFQPNISKRISFPTYPRVVPAFSFEDAMARFLKMVNHMLSVLEIEEFTKLDEFRRFIIALTDDGANALVRTFFLKHAFSVQDQKILGKYNFYDWLVKEGKEIAFIPDPFFKYPFVEEYLKNFTHIYLCLIQICTLNKTRRRQKLPFLFREMNGLFELAYRTDMALAKTLNLQSERTPYFLLWAIDKLLETMIHYLKIGFELDLYGEHEYKSIHWYMYYLARNRVEQYNVLLRYDQMQSPDIQLALQKGSKQKGKAGKKAGKGVIKQPAKSTVVVPTAYYQSMCFDSLLFKSAFYYLQGLDNAKGAAENTIKFNFGTPQNRYEERFLPFFGTVSPTPVHYPQYRLTIQTEYESKSVEDLLNAANATFKEAKSYIEKVLPPLQKSSSSLAKYKAEELKAVFKNLVSNGVNIYMISAKKTYNTPSKKVTYNFDNFPALPIINLV